MTLLRSELMVALNDAIVACREAADQHLISAETCGEHAACAMFGALAERRANAADELAQFVIAAHDIPNAPTAERELLAGAFSRTKAALMPDTLQSLAADSRTREESLATLVDAALAQEPDGRLQVVLEALAQDVAQAIESLDSLTSKSF
ncbi:MAG: hypothetical protein AB7G39_06730 [Alphaproteobacteria bacterium]